MAFYVSISIIILKMINRKFQIESFSMSKPYVIATFTKEQIQPIIEAVKNIKLNKKRSQ